MMVHVRSLRPGRTLTTFALSGALAVGIAACGSSSSSSTGSSGGTAAAASTSSSNARYEARLQLAKCLRSHGLNVPDPSPNGGVAGGAAGGAGGAGAGGAFRSLRDQPNFQSAMQACAKYRRGAFGFGNISPAQQAQFRQDLVKFAECMRSHNINVPDPSTSSGGGFGIFGQIPSSERSSPEFQSALKACSSTLPFRRGRGPGGGPGGGAGGAANPGA
jgi:hypothetical protein